MYKFQTLEFSFDFSLKYYTVSQNNHKKLRISILMYEMTDLKLGLFWVEGWLADLQRSLPAWIFLWVCGKSYRIDLGQKFSRGKSLILRKINVD